MELRRIGNIVNFYGIKGELKVNITTSFPKDRYKQGNEILIKIGEEKYDKYTIQAAYAKNKSVYIVKLKNVDDINLITKYIGCDVYMYVEKIKGTYFFSELIGCKLVNRKGVCLDTVKNVIENVGNTFLLTETDKMIPFINRVFVNKINLEEKKINITDRTEEFLTGNVIIVENKSKSKRTRNKKEDDEN